MNYKNLVKWIPRFSQARVVVVGDLMRDLFIWGKVRRISPEAPVPVVEVTKETAMLGGAANVVNNLTVLGAKVHLAGVVGDDGPGEALISELVEKGVGLEGVVVEQGRPTTIKTRIIAHSQQMVRFDKETRGSISAESRKRMLKALKEVLPEVSLVLISDYAKGVISPELTAPLFKAAHERKKKILVDPKLANLACYKGADVITPNNLEAGQAARFEVESDKDVERAGRIMLDELSAQAILITRGEHGISLIERHKPPRHIPTEAREVYDVTGAGDTVISTLGVGLACGMDLYSATVLANLAAGIGVGKLGTSVVSRDELKEALLNGGL
jgi:D-beta-D-heptose 7-phosphate kinase/D-beta-D-heptose 1-phosphate adenosyltransferase